LVSREKFRRRLTREKYGHRGHREKKQKLKSLDSLLRKESQGLTGEIKMQDDKLKLKIAKQWIDKDFEVAVLQYY